MRKRLTGLGALILILLAISTTGRAADIPCPRPANIRLPANVSFRIYEPKVVFRHDVGLLGLPRVEGHMETPPRGWVLQGITLTNDNLEIRARWSRQTLADGRTCIWLSEVEATLGMPEQHVYVASDYPEWSCEYRAVLAHENKHVAINRSVVQSFAAPMHKALQDGVIKINPLIFSRPNVQDSQVTGFLYSLMRPTWDALRLELKRQNGSIDTPEAYRAEHATSGCKNWFPHGVPGYARH